jgi:predicted MFS family arabinose efflux permease
MSGWLTTGLVAVSYGPIWGWLAGSVVALYVATAILAVLWFWSEQRSKHPLVDMKIMRIRAVWATNLAAMLYGFGMFAMFITVPQFTQTPVAIGYGFGASVTQSGLYLLPFSLAMVVVAPFTGWLSMRIGSKGVLIVGSFFSAVSYAVLVVGHSESLLIYVASALLGVGLAPAFASLANLIIESVPADQTGVATGMNTNIRNIGAALGAGIATSLVISQVMSNGYPEESGYVLAFAVSGIGMVVAALAALLIPTRSTADRALLQSESHPGLTAEGEAIVGAIAYVPEESV